MDRLPKTVIRRRQRQEELREKLKGLEYIRQLDQIDEKLQSGDVTKDELDVLKVRIDLNFKRLAKILPDEKFTEVVAEVAGEMAHRVIEVVPVSSPHKDT
jgi:hypothetical protein